jgi:hypothetical protein
MKGQIDNRAIKSCEKALKPDVIAFQILEP